MNVIDNLLNRVTMYRLVLFTLIGFVAIAFIESGFRMLPFSPTMLAWSVFLIGSSALAVNALFARIYEAPTNPESTYITALILALIISPPTTYLDPSFLALAFWAGAWAAASKYLFAIGNKHLFNPAAFGVAVTALFLGQSATWWVSTSALFPFVLIGGLLITRKIHRFDLVISFLIVASIAIIAPALLSGMDIFTAVTSAFTLVPTIFFATVMLTEPLTTPPTRGRRILYGTVTGALFYPSANILGLYFTPSLALLAGNLLSYLISPKQKLTLTLIDRVRLSPDVFEFVFAPNKPFAYKPGQYLEWTLAHDHADNRSIRRYFTIASAPGDPNIRLGVKFYEPASSFKRTLFALHRGDTLIASQLAGDFTLPRDAGKKLAFIAGGIGITPFASMIRHLQDKNESRDIVLLYANKTAADAAYRDELEAAAPHGVRTVHAFSDEPVAGFPTRIDADTIRTHVPDFMDRTFYISGPHGMVAGISGTLKSLGVPATQIKTDYFPGFA